METPPFIPDDQMLESTDMVMKAPRTSEVVTFEPFYPGFPISKPLPQRSRRNRKSNSKCLENSGIEILPGLFESANYSRYLSLKFDEKRAEDVDMFRICKEITSICGREPKMSFQNYGTLLVKCTSREESERLLSLELMNGTKANCTPHRYLNQCRGVIRSPHLMRYSEERLQEEFESQHVKEVKQMKRKIDGVLVPLPTYVLTFNLVRLPSEIKAAWLRLEVRPYIPSPRKCFFCLRFGHVQDSCRRRLKGENKICNNCGQEEHGDCNRPSFCVNCSENHPASFRYCDRYLLEKEIQTIRAKEHITFAEAKKRVLSQYIRPGTTFASVVDKANKAQKTNSQKNNNSNSSPSSNTASLDKNSTNTKRRRSIEEHDTSPSCKSNRFDVLIDEVDCDDLVTEPEKLDDGIGASCPESVPALVRSVMRAEVHVSADPVEQAGTPALVGFSESAGAMSSVDSRESSEELLAVGSVESSGAGSLVAPGGLVDVSCSANPPEQIGVSTNNLNKDPKSNARNKNDKTRMVNATNNSNRDSSLTVASRNRRIKIPHINSGTLRSKDTKSENKSSSGRPLIKVSSKSNN